MPSSLTSRLLVRAALHGASLLAACAAAVGVAGIMAAGCRTPTAGAPASLAETAVYPPPPQAARVVALGNLRGRRPPTPAQVELSRFIFGVDPPPTLAIANPTGLAAAPDGLLVCDAALDTLIRWDAATGEFQTTGRAAVFDNPFAVDVGPGGELLVCDYYGVRRFDRSGAVQATYRLESESFRPAGALVVGDAVWVSNDAMNRIEVFALSDGAHRASIGRRGRGPSEFYLPRGMARTPGGQVCVVDLLNNRVQVLAAGGEWVRDIGGPGDITGTFGRPKDVAVGPDGTVFVTDAFSQRVHAFDAEGTPLLAFGEPGSGVGALALPNGIAVVEYPPTSEVDPPDGERILYYILVSEQLDRPGVRVYGWLEPRPARVAAAPAAAAAAPADGGADVENPHWNAHACSACHTVQSGRAQPIAAAQVDALCVTCHDGVRAAADPHPIGRPARSETVATPPDWPTVDGAIGCVTCHEFERHCSGAPPPASRAQRRMLRNYDPARPLEYCATCHVGEVGGTRFSPHRQRDEQGRIRDDACFFCHTIRPEIPPDGRRRFDPKLRVDTSDLCLNCHRPHWDLSPRGHVDRPVTPRILDWMLRNERAGRVAGPADEQRTRPAVLPLGRQAVTCYTCHNPHYPGLFPPGSELGARATNPSDRAAALRADWIELCSQCHNR